MLSPRCCVAAWLFCVLAAGQARAVPMAVGTKIGIDFGPTLTTNWNNIATNNQTIASGSVVNLSGATLTGVSLVIANSQFVNNDGTDNWKALATKGGNAPPEFVESVVTDIAGNNSLVPDDTPFRITLSGLDTAFVYQIVAVSTAAGSPIDTYKITGAAVHGPSAIVRTNAVQGAFHTFTNVAPSSAGTIVIEVTDTSAGKNPITNGILLTATSPGNPDSDGDGLLDTWEIEKFGTLLKAAAGDEDGDGDTNLTEFTHGTNPADITSHSAVLQAWQVDFQGGTGGALGSANPVTATSDLGMGSKWNAFQIAATNGDVFANPPTNHNAAIDPLLNSLYDAANLPTTVDLQIAGGVSGFNVGRVLAMGGIDEAFGDHWFWGAQGRTTATVGFTFKKLLPGTYSLTAYANPDQHNPPRDFGLVVGAVTKPINPIFSSGFHADAGTFAGTVRDIVVDGSGVLTGSLTTIGGDPSIAAMVLRRIAAPTSAVASNDAATVNKGGSVRIPVLGNDVPFPPLGALTILTSPAAGTAVVTSDNAIRYTHHGGPATGDSLTYRFTDASGTSNTATVTLTIATGRVAPETVTLPLQAPQSSYSLEDAFKGRGAFNFGTPTWMTTIPGNTKRFFVSERTGVIWEIPDMGAATATRRVFADLSASLDLFTEMGVKSFAFHPAFESGSPYLYVTYNYEPTPSATVGTVRLSRFTVLGNGTGVVDPASEQILFEVDSRSQDHNLDSCRFGPDGYLYVGSGDERRPAENAQTITNLFWSSVIRIDVDRRAENLEPNDAGNLSLSIPKDGGVARYKVPVDNPFAATTGTVNYRDTAYAASAVRSEIYITGVRNPWTFSFDVVDGEPVLWLGDVGSDGGDSREEVNIFRKGDNGGWNILEGGRYNSTPPAGLVLRSPEYSYARGSGTFDGASVIGGFVYRGTRYPALDGKYLFGDWLNGHVWTLQRGAVAGAPTVARITGLSGVVGFATDPSNGDILALSWNSQSGGLFDGSGQVGKVFRLKAQLTAGSPFPETLGATGLFADLANLTPNPGLHAYEPNVTFWSDHAKKQRWFALPGVQEKMTWAADGAFTFPTGTMWVKHFEIETTRGNPSTRKRLETRVIVKNDEGIYGISYRWNEAGTEATLVGDAGDAFDLAITDPALPPGQQSITQRWQIPSRSQCLTCHNPDSGQVLGFDSRQLNRDDIPLDGATGNFLQLLTNAGYLQGLAASPATLPKHHAADDSSVDVESRVRSYLAVNCSYCHADSGGLDLRAQVPLEATHLLNYPDQGQISINDPAIRRVVPGSPGHSSVLQRVAGTPGFNKMPPLASSVVDAQAVALLTDWIQNGANSAPVFAVGDAPVFVIAADAQPGTIVADLHAVDADAPRDTVVHAIASGNAGGLFAIDAATGILSVAGDIAGAGPGLIQLVITASDQFPGNPKTATLTVLIDPSGINDSPRFMSPQHYYIPSTMATGSRVGVVKASDPERSPVTLALTGGTAGDRFVFNAATGQITRGAGAIATGETWTMNFSAVDGNVPPASAGMTVTFHITGVETAADTPPAGGTFWNVDFQGDGSNTAAGQTTTPLTATKGGMTWNAFQVKAYSGNPAVMSVNPTMALKTHAGTQTGVTFHIFNDDDPATPIGSGVFGYSGRTGLDGLTGDYLLLLNATTAYGAMLHQWEITGLTPGWQYDLLMQGGYDGSTARGIAFTVDTDGDGLLTDEAPLYVQANASATVNSGMVRSVVADSAGRILGQSARTPPEGQTWGESNWAGIQIRSAQSSPPVFTVRGPFTVVENAAAGTVVGEVAAVDPDGTTVNYGISSGNGGGNFALDAVTGRLTTTGPLDYEAAPVHVLEISATDAGGVSSMATVIVHTGNGMDTNGERVAAWLAGLGGGLSGFNADPDGDGIANAFEYLYGTSPVLADAGGRMVMGSEVTGNVRTLWLEVTVDAAVADVLKFHAEVSEDCVEWVRLTGNPVVVSEIGGRRVLRYADTAPWPGGAGRRFMRLRMGSDQ